jgi:flagellar basal body-associated protein FliL
MSRILIMVVAGFIVLAGGAITIMQQLEMGPFAPKVDAAAAPAAPSGRVDPVRFVSMEVLVVPIIQNDRVISTIQIEIQIETTQSREQGLNKQMPKLTDAFVTDLRSYVPRILRDKNDVDTETLKKRLAIIGERAIGKGMFDAVLIQSVLERKV